MCQMALKIYQSMLKIVPNTIPSKICKKLLRFCLWQNFAQYGHDGLKPNVPT